MYDFIVNLKARSGYGKNIWRLIEHELKRQNVIYQKHITHYEYHAIKIAKQILNTHKSISHIVVVGGDGTMNEVINGISSFKNVVLGYIPTGSSNDLAKGLGIPSDPIKALNLALHPTRYSYYDQGNVTLHTKMKSRKYVVSCGIGYDACVCKEALNSKLKLFFNHLGLGKLTYAAIALKQLLRFQPFNGELMVDGTKRIILHNIYMISGMIHKTEGGGLIIAPDADPSDQQVSVCVVSDIKKYMFFFILPSLLTSKQKYFKGLRRFNCRTLEIHLEKSQIVHTDGEFTGKEKELSLGCTKEKLRMIR
ncbi:transcription regulator with diacylglycerol kinase catalytic domain [Lachnospiraceae bacterium KM106-2]|nr:transcription regulator with diacylglycerol kinase catalytic domain [Lachnospiraceae bacterium KM106-2]